MRLVLMHLDDAAAREPEEEAMFVVPGGERTAIAAPFAALDRMVAILGQALADAPAQRCAACGESPASPPTDPKRLPTRPSPR